jgi:hypothetical protein
MKNTITLFGLTIAAILLLSCQKKELSVDEVMTTQGYIDLRITGRSADGELLDETVRYNTYPKDQEEFFSSVTETENGLHFTLGRFNDITQSQSAIISFDYNGTDASNGYASIFYKKNLEGNTILSLYAESGFNCGPAVVVIEKYDEQTREIGGNFSIQVINPGENNTDRIALIDGEFYIQVKRIVK